MKLQKLDRRKFIKEASCAVGATICVGVPVGAGLRVGLDSLREKPTPNKSFIRLTDVSELEVGVPKKFAITREKRDKWSRYENVPVGAVYLSLAKTSGKKPKVTALNTSCPHLGCFVDYRSNKKDFFCPCHASNFSIDGKRKKGVSPRDMDELTVEIRNNTEVWVEF